MQRSIETDAASLGSPGHSRETFDRIRLRVPIPRESRKGGPSPTVAASECGADLLMLAASGVGLCRNLHAVPVRLVLHRHALRTDWR